MTKCPYRWKVSESAIIFAHLFWGFAPTDLCVSKKPKIWKFSIWVHFETWTLKYQKSKVKDMKIKVSFDSQNPKKVFLSSVNFPKDLRQNVSIWITPTYSWDSYGNFCVWKRWGNKTWRSTSNKQSWPSWYVKKWTSWRCGIGLNILLPIAVPVVCRSYCWPHTSDYHYDITVSDHTKCVILHRHTFGLLSHHGRHGAGGLRRKSQLDGAKDLLSKIWQHITTVSFVSAFIVVCFRKPKNASGCV